MTAVALIVSGNYVLMAADGVCSRSDGTVAGYMPKLTLLPSMDTVLAVTGVGGFDYLLQWFMPTHVSSFDDLIDALPALVHKVHDHIVENGLAHGGDTRASVIVAGWSALRDAFEGYRVVTFPKDVTSAKTGERTVLEPWKLLPMPEGTWCSALISPENLKRFGVVSGIEETDDRLITRVICAARAESGAVIDENGGRFNAGGFVQLAMLERNYVQSWIAHRWPEDVIGAPIDPSLGAPMPAYLMEGRPVEGS